MYVIRAIGLPKPYLQLFREVRTDHSHATHWSFTGVRLAARHFADRHAAAVVKAKLVNLMLCTGRGEIARSLRVEPAIPGQIAADTSSSFAETEPRATEPTGCVKMGKIACALVGCVLTLSGVGGCAGPKVVAEAAYRGEARSAEAGELVASIRAEWN